MKNLAGCLDCDQQIEKELNNCGIELFKLPVPLQSEVPASILGTLGKFRFHRAWYYWVVKGLVPLKVAQELYGDPVGRKDVRAEGHCACPAPEKQLTWRTPDGLTVIATREETNFDKLIQKGHLPSNAKDGYIFSDDPESAGAQAYVEGYHIDSEAGLLLFANTIRKHGLDKTV